MLNPLMRLPDLGLEIHGHCRHFVLRILPEISLGDENLVPPDLDQRPSSLQFLVQSLNGFDRCGSGDRATISCMTASDVITRHEHPFVGTPTNVELQKQVLSLACF